MNSRGVLPEFWEVFPSPGFVFKFSKLGIPTGDKDDAAKLFINVCHCNDLPPPLEDLTEDELATRIDSGDYTFRIPLTIGALEEVVDNKGKMSKKIDILVNSTFYEHRLASKNDKFYRHYLCMVMCDAIKDKHDIQLDPTNAITLVNRVKVGMIEPQRIIKKPQAGTKVKEVSEKAESSVVVELDASDTLKPDENEAIEDKTPGCFTIRWLGDKLELKLKVPEEITSEECLTLRLKSDRLQLLVRNSHSLFDFRFPVLIDPSVARSHFDVSKRVVVVSSRCLLP
ncbi:unnamed protein product, partial [Mesorhabditis spiculigera]